MAADAPSAGRESKAAPEGLHYAPGAAQLQMLQIEAVRESPLPATETLSARIAYDEDRTARLFPAISGRVDAIRVHAGDRVTAGQVLLTLESGDYAAAKADLQKAQADDERRNQALIRARDLATDQSIAAKDLESAEADAQSARAELQRARERLRALHPVASGEGDLALAMRSPFAGTVTERNASAALEVYPGQASPLVVVSDLGRLWAYIDVPDRYAADVMPGRPVVLVPDADPSRTYRGTVAQVARVLDPATRRLAVRASIENRDGHLMPEMFARARIVGDERAVIQIPASAVVVRGNASVVFVESTPGTFLRRPVTLLRRDPEEAYVGEGLRPGERIVTTGALLLDAEYPEPAGPAT
jgi:membrane fusion protein, heavy metal efflux system